MTHIPRAITIFLMVASVSSIPGSAAQARFQVSVGRNFPGSPSFRFDADGAVGPEHYAEITNLGLRVIRLSDGAVTYDAPLSDFWPSKVGIADPGGFDPHLEFDHASSRWIAMSVSGAFSADSAVLIGVSVTSDPGGSWQGIRIDADPSNLRWADYPVFGIDGAAIYIYSGLVGIAGSTPFAFGLLSIPKADVLASPPTSARLSRFISVFDFNPIPPLGLQLFSRPQHDYLGTTSDGLLFDSISVAGFPIDNRWYSSIFYQRLMGSHAAGAALLPWAQTPFFSFSQPSNPIPQGSPSRFGAQPGTTYSLLGNIGNNNIRVGDFAYSVGYAGVLGRTGVVYLKFHASTNEIVDAGFLGEANYDYLDPSISANPNGDVLIAFTRTGATEYASLYCAAGRVGPGGRLEFAPPVLLKPGSEIYDEAGPNFGDASGPGRYSDYSSAVTVHPSDPSRFWVSGPYVGQRNLASTWISEVIFPPVATPTPGPTATPGAGLGFYPVAPCRLVDTRVPGFGGPFSLVSASSTSYVGWGVCGIHSDAQALSLNVTVVAPQESGFLTLWPSHRAKPVASSLNFAPGQTRANNVIVPLSPDSAGTFNVYLGSLSSTHLVVDVSGYFK